MIGKTCLVRTFSAGLHFGKVRSIEGKNVVLENASRIWSWVGANTLHEISLGGVKEGSCISKAVEEILLTEAIEVIPITEVAIASMASQWN